MTNPTPEQVEAARAEYDRSEDMCAALVAAAGTPVSGSTSDGHHTFDELYDYRMLYNVHAAHGWLAAGIPVVKSWKHSDGDLCFGGGWFIVTATLPTGQVSNHYKAEHWGLFAVPEIDLPPEYDGHTPQDAAERLRAAAGVTPPGPRVELLREAREEFLPHSNDVWALDLVARLANALATPPRLDEAKLAEAIAEELNTDGWIAEEWSNGKLNATARRLVDFAVMPVLRGGGQ